MESLPRDPARDPLPSDAAEYTGPGPIPELIDEYVAEGFATTDREREDMFLEWLDARGRLPDLLEEVGALHECPDQDTAEEIVRQAYTGGGWQAALFGGWGGAREQEAEPIEPEALRVARMSTAALLELKRDLDEELQLRGVAIS
jgi:hypothetical protein